MHTQTFAMSTTPPLLKTRLSLMMFLQYAIWGAWLPLMYQYLSGHVGFNGEQIGYLFMVGGVGAVFAPFIAGQIADRYFNTEKYLAISHLLGGVLVWQLSWIEDYWSFFAFSLVYSLIYSPTLALTNSISFHHLPDRDRDFGKVRLWGTIGWIAVGICIGQWLLHAWTPNPETPITNVSTVELVRDPARAEVLAKDSELLEGVLTRKLIEQAWRQMIDEQLKIRNIQPPTNVGSDGESLTDYPAAVPMLGLTNDEIVTLQAAKLDELLRARAQAKGISNAFTASAILGIVLGLFCLTLPATPPSPGRQRLAFVEALKEVRRQPLLTLFLIAVPISCIHQFYFVHTSAFLNSYQARVGEVAESINGLFGVGGGGLMTIGQMSEILVLALIPLVAKKLSRKSLLTVGVIAYALRMFLFAYVESLPFSPLATLIAGVALHGLCFGCFIFVAFMVVDEQTTADVRASAQGLFGLVVFGVGIIVGSIVAGYVGDWAKIGGATDYTRLFAVPMWGAVGCLLLLLLFYPGGKQAVAEPRGGDGLAR